MVSEGRTFKDIIFKTQRAPKGGANFDTRDLI